MMWSEEERRKVRRSYSYRKASAIGWLFGWTFQIPLICVAGAFWSGVLDEGLMSTVTPRWGMLTFHFLNDGMHPTLWHTWQQITRPNGKFSGIWIPRAPRNLEDARRIEAYYRRKHSK